MSESEYSSEQLQREINSTMRLRDYEKSNPHLIVSAAAPSKGGF